jgi:hypothetical protein
MERKGHVQALTVVRRLCRDIERDPPVRPVERHRAHFLQVTWARACTHRERRRRVRVVEPIAEEDAEFLDRKSKKKRMSSQALV